MLCPSLLTKDEQVSMLNRVGFDAIRADDITAHVLPTWEHCQKLMGHPMVQLVLHAKGGKLRRFVDSFRLMEEGYRTGAMAYGMLTATRAPNRLHAHRIRAEEHNAPCPVEDGTQRD